MQRVVSISAMVFRLFPANLWILGEALRMSAAIFQTWLVLKCAVTLVNRLMKRKQYFNLLKNGGS